MSERETAIQALQAVVEAAVGVMEVIRDATRPEKVPARGVLILRSGETQAAEPIMSPLTYAIEHQCEVVAIHAAEDATERAEALDATIGAIAAAIAADRTLGGAVEWAQPGAPAADTDDTEGLTPVGAMSMPITLFFTAADSPAG